jgi:hypothetical protein
MSRFAGFFFSLVPNGASRHAHNADRSFRLRWGLVVDRGRRHLPRVMRRIRGGCRHRLAAGSEPRVIFLLSAGTQGKRP